VIKKNSFVLIFIPHRTILPSPAIPLGLENFRWPISARLVARTLLNLTVTVEQRFVGNATITPLLLDVSADGAYQGDQDIKNWSKWEKPSSQKNN
jgi:hypothetical protein